MIAEGKYTQGEVSFPVNMDDARKTFDAVAALSNSDKIKLATINHIPTEPFNKTLLTGILKSVVQNAWWAAKKGVSSPEFIEVTASHAARLARYKSDIAVSVSAVDLLARKPKATREDKALRYTIDADKYEADWKEWRGSRYLVIKAMLDAKAVTGQPGAPLSSILAAMTETRESAVPTRNGVSQIVKALIAKGIAACTNPGNAKAPRGSKKAAVAPPAPPAVPLRNHAAPVTKKKH